MRLSANDGLRVKEVGCCSIFGSRELRKRMEPYVIDDFEDHIEDCLKNIVVSFDLSASSGPMRPTPTVRTTGR